MIIIIILAIVSLCLMMLSIWAVEEYDCNIAILTAFIASLCFISSTYVMFEYIEHIICY